MITPQAAAEKWSRNLQNAQQSMTDGANAVTQAPGQAAVAKRQKWVAAMTNVATQDKWARNTAAVTLEEWRAGYINKGIPNISRGVQMATPKMTSFMNKLLPFVAAGQQQIKSMPDITPADADNRMLAFIKYMRTFKG